MTETLEEFILIEGTDDWVPLFAIDGFAKKIGLNEVEMRYRTILAAISKLHGDGMLLVGELDREGQFRPWEGAFADVIPPIKGFDAQAPELDWGFDLWTSNTPAGDALGLVAARVHRRLPE